MSLITKTFNALKQLKVLVIGDVMIDSYCYGMVDRISPEAPVPIVSISKKENRLGGAANVALNCAALGAKVSLASVCGNDEGATILRELLEDAHIEHELLHESEERPTTIKTRIISRGQQVVRLDEENTAQLSIKDEHRFIDKVLKYIQMHKPEVVIFEDYDKGVLGENVIEKISTHAMHAKAVVAVDPKFRNFSFYKNVTLLKPNLNEVKVGLELKSIDAADVKKYAHTLSQRLMPDNLLITMSEHGVFYQNKNKDTGHHPAATRQISDVSGAGDTVISVAAMVLAATQNMALAAEWSNIAGGMVCEYVGVVPINAKDLEQELKKENI